MVRRLLPVVCLVWMSGACFGQAIGAYFNPIVTRASNSQPDNGTFAFLGQGNTSALRGGVSLGGYYMFAQGARASFGVDIRDEWQGGNDSLLNSFLLGVRATGHVGERLKPYAEVLGGVGTTRAPLTIVRTSKPMVKGYVGLDYTVNRHLDFRPVEIGYGELTTTSTGLYNGTSYPSAQLLSFSAGLVARFGKR
jgi:hypothetical protein